MEIGRKHFGVVIFCSEGQHGVKIPLHRWSLIKEKNKKGGGIRCDNRVKCSKKNKYIMGGTTRKKKRLKI